MGKHDVAPTPERMRRGDIVRTYATDPYGERKEIEVWQSYDDPPVIDWLSEHDHITAEQHNWLRDYREDLIRSGIWRSPPAGTYGEITGGDQSIVADLAFTRITRIERYVRERAGFAAMNLLRNVAIDGATVPAHAPPGWLRPFRRAVNVAMDWR